MGEWFRDNGFVLMSVSDVDSFYTDLKLGNTPSLSTMISPSRPLPTVRCLSSSVVHQVVRPTLESESLIAWSTLIAS